MVFYTFSTNSYVSNLNDLIMYVDFKRFSHNYSSVDIHTFSLWSPSFRGNHNLNKLKSKLFKGVSTYVSAFLSNHFAEENFQYFFFIYSYVIFYPYPIVAQTISLAINIWTNFYLYYKGMFHKSLSFSSQIVLKKTAKDVFFIYFNLKNSPFVPYLVSIDHNFNKV